MGSSTEAPRVRLVALSFLMLFLELALIRWIGSNVLYLSYFSNFILLASFLGIGLGFLRANAGRDPFRFAPIALAVLVGFVRLFRSKSIAPARNSSSSAPWVRAADCPRSSP